jgi:hypothetical protein
MAVDRERELEIKRDIPKLYEKIEQAHRAKNDLERHIGLEKQAAMELNFYIREDKLRIKEGLKPKYEVAAMEANIERHYTNIKMFEEKKKQEDETIARIKGMISVLEEDLKPPKEIVIDMRPKKELPFRKKIL